MSKYTARQIAESDELFEKQIHKVRKFYLSRNPDKMMMLEERKAVVKERNKGLSPEYDKEFVPEKLIPNNDDKKHPCWKINKRKKEGREFIDRWRRKFRGINGRLLNKFGIPVMHEETGRYFHWLPVEKDGIYYVSVGSSLLDCMPSAKSEQFEIEV